MAIDVVGSALRTLGPGGVMRTAAGLPGVSEAKAFARQAVENVGVQSRALLEQRTGEMKVPYMYIYIYIHYI